MSTIYKVSYKEPDGKIVKEQPIRAASALSACSVLHKALVGRIITDCFCGDKEDSGFSGRISYHEVVTIFSRPYVAPVKSKAPEGIDFDFLEQVDKECRKARV